MAAKEQEWGTKCHEVTETSEGITVLGFIVMFVSAFIHGKGFPDWGWILLVATIISAITAVISGILQARSFYMLKKIRMTKATK